MSTAAIAAALAVAISPADSLMWQVPGQAFENPAVRQWMLPHSSSSVGLTARDDHRNGEAVAMMGTGEYAWGVDARSFIKAGLSTVWGTAQYDNGRQTGRITCETSEPEMVYPYFTVDTVGGPLRKEHYAFSGGYATTAGTDSRLAWGVSGGYRAGLYYRATDPRPRNTTGLLNITAGIGYRLFGDYYGAVSARYSKYKQSNDIDFKSQMGVEKIYHYTGLGHHYVRFAGVGYDNDYSGHEWQGQLTLYPSAGRGFSASAALSRYSVTKILTELNKLPLAKAVQWRFRGQAAWVGRVIGVSFDADVWRRRGYENIFGDASSGIYPHIGRYHRSSHCGYVFRAGALAELHPRTATLLNLGATAGLTRNEFCYMTPPETRRADAALVQALARITMPFAGRWRLGLGATYQGYLAFDKLDIDNIYGRNVQRLGADALLSMALNAKLTLRLAAMYAHTDYGAGVRGNSMACSLAVVF